MRFGIIVFPGTNCDGDCWHVLTRVLDCHGEFVWHEERDVSRFDCLVLPGGFPTGTICALGRWLVFRPLWKP